MTTAFTESDALGLYHTSAVSEGISQPDPDLCLGGARAGTPVKRLTALIDTPIPPVAIDDVSGRNGVGVGTIIGADISSAQAIEDSIEMIEEDKQLMFGTDTLTWAAPEEVAGTAVVIHDGDTVLLESGVDDSKSIRVTRDGFTSVNGEMTLTLTRELNNAIGMSNVTNAQRAAGVDTYHAVMFRAHGTQNITSLKVWIRPLIGEDAEGSSQRVTDAAQLPGAGAGTIGTLGTDTIAPGTFAGWPDTGGATIYTFPTFTVRETVYYSSRTDTVLTVPALGRGLLGSAAAGGAATDIVTPVPLMRIGKETPGGDGSIQTIANENAAPAAPAPTWSVGTFDTVGVSIGGITSGNNHGLWIHREIPAGAGVAAFLLGQIEYSYTAGGTSYRTTAYGDYRVADTTLELYEVYLGEDEAADLTASPDDTNVTLPTSTALTPGAGDIEFNAVIRFRNRYDLVSINQYNRRQSIDNAGDAITAPVSAPDNIQILNSAGGEVDVTASYFPSDDSSPGDTFRLYHRADGADPVVGVDTPTAITMTADPFFGRPQFNLDAELGPNPVGAKLHTLVTAFRTSDSAESANRSIILTTIDTATTIPSKRRAFLGRTFAEAQVPPVISVTTVYDAGTSTETRATNGKTELWVGGTMVWRLMYDSLDSTNNGIWTTFGYTQNTISGAAGADPVDVVDANNVYITVGSGPGSTTRRMWIDLASTDIQFEAIRQVTAEAVTSHTSTHIAAFPWHTLFSVFDNGSLDWVTVLSLDRTNGSLAFNNSGWQQRQTIGELADTT